MKTHTTPANHAPRSILILHSSIDGHTQAICERLQRTFHDKGINVTLLPLQDFSPAGHDPELVVIGASIRYGHHRPALARLLQQHVCWLARRRQAFFSVCLTARKPGKASPEGNAYVRRFLKNTGWQPEPCAVFAGKLDYARYRPLDRLMIRLIMHMTGGPTDPATCVSYTDWQAVEQFAQACLVRGDTPESIAR
ncbi:menaquinone-dependent protoporphyrinogen IX dehydrogenase [Uliginosibacterium paludis]|uniref:Protoporphyrinogen IX dehydrogenase [quinone] n=1 Tax=Uliginosibacterium paludis TaxID=1615952 RepID=A0ABV2CKK9_9RHOO